MLLEDLVHLRLLLSSMLLDLAVETVDLVVLLKRSRHFLSLKLHFLHLSVLLVEKGAQFADLVILGGYDLVLLLVHKVPILVLLDYELLELLVLHLLVFE